MSPAPGDSSPRALTLHQESDKNLMKPDSMTLVPLPHPGTSDADIKLNPFKRQAQPSHLTSGSGHSFSPYVLASVDLKKLDRFIGMWQQVLVKLTHPLDFLLHAIE